MYYCTIIERNIVYNYHGNDALMVPIIVTVSNFCKDEIIAMQTKNKTRSQTNPYKYIYVVKCHYYICNWKTLFNISIATRWKICMLETYCILIFYYNLLQYIIATDKFNLVLCNTQIYEHYIMWISHTTSSCYNSM